MANATPTPVIVTGAAGKMGREVIKAVAQADDLKLYAAVDRNPEVFSLDAGELVGIEALDIALTHELEPILAAAAQEKQPCVMVDFTHPSSVYKNIRLCYCLWGLPSDRDYRTTRRTDGRSGPVYRKSQYGWSDCSQFLHWHGAFATGCRSSVSIF